MSPTHGIPSTYRSYGCRCDACRAANTAFQNEWMKDHPEQREKHRQRARLRNRAVAANGTRAKPPSKRNIGEA